MEITVPKRTGNIVSFITIRDRYTRYLYLLCEQRTTPLGSEGTLPLLVLEYQVTTP